MLALRGGVQAPSAFSAARLPLTSALTVAHRRPGSSFQSSPSAGARAMRPGGAANSSFDSDEELDSSLASELSKIANPGRQQTQASKLDLLWKIGKVQNRPEPCSCCSGAKDKECDWCHGTGVLTVGDQVFASTASHRNQCPVCNGEGYTPCNHCRGTGFRAKWLPGGGSPVRA